MDSQNQPVDAPQLSDDSKHPKQAQHLPERLRSLSAEHKLVVLWTSIEQGLEYCLQPEVESISMQTHVTIYTAIYDYIMSHLHRSNRVINGREVYTLLNHRVIEYLKELREEFNHVVGEFLLGLYVSQWARWERKVACICSVFTYLERCFVNRERDEGKRDIHKLLALHMIRWKEEIFDPVQEDSLKVVRELAERQRDGEPEEDSVFQQFTDAVASMGKQIDNTQLAQRVLVQASSGESENTTS